ncbi:MAG TPA: aldehyde dehydrogenase family protein, partial [Bradyrhizobium sp.]|nr:aldehyde dehydrogenase family protein [Bradyrhizobium sp.]
MAGSFFRAFVQGCLPNVPFPFHSPEIKRFTMVNRMQFYIDGAWVDPVVKKSTPVVNPATEEAMYEVALGSKADVDKAVAAARRAFAT